MGNFSMIHWLIFSAIFVIVVAGTMMGVFRAVKNRSALHAIASVSMPVYGIFYFFAGKREAS